MTRCLKCTILPVLVFPQSHQITQNARVFTPSAVVWQCTLTRPYTQPPFSRILIHQSELGVRAVDQWEAWCQLCPIMITSCIWLAVALEGLTAPGAQPSQMVQSRVQWRNDILMIFNWIQDLSFLLQINSYSDPCRVMSSICTFRSIFRDSATSDIIFYPSSNKCLE